MGRPDGLNLSLPRKATKKQIDFMMILFNDVGLGTRVERLAYLSKRTIHVNALDEMTLEQAQRIIGLLLKLKEEERKWDDYSDDYFYN